MQALGSRAPPWAGPDRLEDIMSEPGLVDSTGRVRSPAATPGHWAGYAPSQGAALPGRSAERRGERPGGRLPTPRPDRGASLPRRWDGAAPPAVTLRMEKTHALQF